MLRMLGRPAVVSRTAVRAFASVTTAFAATTPMQRQTAYVRFKPDADNLTISLVLAGRQRNLNRPVDEPLEKPLSRIKANLKPAKQDKRNKKKKLDPAAAAAAGGAGQEQQSEQQELFIGLFRDAQATQPFDTATPNGQAWPSAALLRVGSQDFEVLLNPPTVETISLQNFPMVGYPLLPAVTYAFADPQRSRYRWLRKPQQQQQQQQQQQKGRSVAAAAAEGDAGWEDTGCHSLCYTPSHEDLGCILRVECTPYAAAAATAAAGDAGGTAGGGSLGGNGTEQQQQQGLIASASKAAAAGVVHGEAATADTGPVRAGPAQPAARLRQLSPGVALDEAWRLRVMSYNILADQYAGTAYAQQVLFKYCPTELLDNNYRRQLVLEEILRYQPDICCLQEVDDKVFAEYLAPHLTRNGFRGHYTNKQGSVREGSAMFWRSHKWGAAAVQDVMLRDVFKGPLSGRHQQFADMLDSSPELEHALQKVATIAQMVLLVPRAAAAAATGSTGSNGSNGGGLVGQPAPVLMINTHLFFHPYAPHIRTLHTAAVLEEAAAALTDWQQQAQAAAAATQQQQQQPAGSSGSSVVEPELLAALVQLPPPTLLFCGDLNSDLNDGVPGVIELLQTGQLSANHWDWKMGATFKWGKDEEEYANEGQMQQQQGEQQQQQQQQQSDGHDFDPPAESPTSTVPIIGKDVTIPFVLRSADDLATPYTNYTSGYQALLDYVWYDPSRLTVTRQLPQPSEELLKSFIPSPNFPSDHLAVVYDLAFKPRKPAAAAAAAAAAVAADGSSSGSSGGGPVVHAAGAFTLLPASEDHVCDAVEVLRGGQVLAMPTDTLYGLAAAAGNPAAVQQLRRIKQRSEAAPLAVAVADVADVSRYCQTQHLPPGLLAALLPGPVTVLLPRSTAADAAPLAEGVFGPGRMDAAAATAAGTAAAAAAVAGVRVVPNEFVRGVCRSLGEGLALTSANLSGGESSLCTADFRDLWQYCGAVFDGGKVPVSSNLGSTVVDLTSVGQTGAASGFRIVRPGVAADSVVEVLTKSFGLKQLE